MAALLLRRCAIFSCCIYSILSTPCFINPHVFILWRKSTDVFEISKVGPERAKSDLWSLGVLGTKGNGTPRNQSRIPRWWRNLRSRLNTNNQRKPLEAKGKMQVKGSFHSKTNGCSEDLSTGTKWLHIKDGLCLDMSNSLLKLAMCLSRWTAILNRFTISIPCCLIAISRERFSKQHSRRESRCPICSDLPSIPQSERQTGKL